MTGSSARVAVLEPPMAFGRPLLRQLEEAGYAIRSCTSAAEVESLAADALVDAALIVPPAGVAVSDAERARLARLCLSLPTLVALPQLDATLAGLRDLIARGHRTADASRDGLARSRSLAEPSGTLLRKTRGRLEHRSGTDSRRVSSDDEGLLTARQQEIAALIADGLSNAEIASRLVVTPGTVANHVAEILRRLGYRRRAQIARWVAEQHPAAR